MCLPFESSVFISYRASPETSGHGQAATRSQNTGDVGQDLADLLRLADELHEHMLPGDPI